MVSSLCTFFDQDSNVHQIHGHPTLQVLVEVTTGPLCQGFTNSLGLTIAQAHVSCLKQGWITWVRCYEQHVWCVSVIEPLTSTPIICIASPCGLGPSPTPTTSFATCHMPLKHFHPALLNCHNVATLQPMPASKTRLHLAKCHLALGALHGSEAPMSSALPM